MFAVVRLRGSVNRDKKTKDAMAMLRLHRINHCVLLPENTATNGMLKRVENWVTWGEVSKEQEKELKQKRKGPVYRLSPPSHGLKSIKAHYPKGDLGYRGKEIDKLLKRMV